MKTPSLGLAAAVLALASCGVMNAPLNSTSSFDPLKPPGSGSQVAARSSDSNLSPGSFVKANIPNTAFFKNKPKGTEDADKLLALGTNMKIVSSDPNYVKVELDSGEVGWVPAVMVASANASADAYPVGGTYQVYPPLPGGGPIEPLPMLDPKGLPPEGAIPTIIDPDAPAAAPGAPIKIDKIPNLIPVKPEEKPEPEADANKDAAQKPKDDATAPQ